MEEVRNLPRRFERFERLQKDMQKDMRQLRQDVREVKLAQISLAAATNQRSVQIIEHHALLLSEISWLLQGAGISPQSNVPRSMYLGDAPNPSAMSLADLANRWPSLFDGSGELAPSPTNNKDTAAKRAPTCLRANDVIEETRETAEAPGGVGSEQEMDHAVGLSSVTTVEPVASIPTGQQVTPLSSSRGSPPDTTFPAGPSCGPHIEVGTEPAEHTALLIEPCFPSILAPTLPPLCAAPEHSADIHRPPPQTILCPVASPSILHQSSGPPSPSLSLPPEPPVLKVAPLMVVSEFVQQERLAPLPLSPIMERQEDEQEAMDVDVPQHSHPVSTPVLVSVATTEQPLVPTPPIATPQPLVPTSAGATLRPVASTPPPRASHSVPPPSSTPPPAPNPTPTTPCPPAGAALTESPTDVIPPESQTPVVLAPLSTPPLVVPAPIPTPPPAVTTAPASSGRGIKRGRSSSVVPTRISKRLRGETPL
jgi:hypothetical protein